ncbi:MAG: LapA family protein [Deltaproteobacteria bacterium]|nr:LapA family protein [Deltaproteobacteria bacterium]
MKRLVFAIIMSALFFALLNFVYCNLDQATFAYPVVFKFRIPVVLSEGFQSVALPLGFILLISFCLGMVAIALLEALPSFYKTLELRARNKKIRELERELTVARQLAGVDKPGSLRA